MDEDTPLIVLANPPGVVRAGSEEAYGSVNLDRVMAAIDDAGSVFKTAEDLDASPDDLAALREAVNTLSDAVRTLAGEVYGIARGIENRRIATSRG